MRLYSKMGDTKQVRVDNWGIFFLQRLQMFFSKTDYCDMTLQFEGNVQLKVHRLVINACTEYFQVLEQSCSLDENVILMPSDLQADVIVPIVNFMYTGMLEFHLSTFDRLYKTAQVMNITILTKLLDAQKQQPAHRSTKRKQTETTFNFSTPVKKSTPMMKSVSHNAEQSHSSRKLNIYKRKPPTSSQSGPLFISDSNWNPAKDPLLLTDNTPKPTRFEWPEDDLPSISMMDTSFEDISYTSKPLLTKNEAHRPGTSFDDLRHIPNANRTASNSKATSSSPNLDMEEMKNYVKEQKIRSDLSQDDEVISINVEMQSESGQKRKPEAKIKSVMKKVRFDEQESKTATISIATDGKNVGDLNHDKIVSEILKKYPDLVRKNKNIKLKIMAKNKGGRIEQVRVESVQKKSEQPKLQSDAIPTLERRSNRGAREVPFEQSNNKTPWVCDRCSTPEEPVEFVLYYLYRKHMTDVHNEKFDAKQCKYCGHHCSNPDLLMYHLYTKHGLKPQPGFNFPKCDLCPFIALNNILLERHKCRHTKKEVECVECKLAFTSHATLTSHIQITGHSGKSEKPSYDCQYCTKRYQSGVNLFSHVRLQHKNEAIRDGIVSVDEPDDAEDFEEEDSSKDEYILPEIIPENVPGKKVNILSNVKVQDRHEQQHQLALEPSSEAEALNNVATGIATSLGLVDIVVLNENQPEFILPELADGESFGQAANEVITSDGVLTQSMLSSGDIGSTDELVMVLTDHDYGDNQEEINTENSNIVVLYSHPVDGQQNQFITSEGNIIVNSETGLFEIRNGAAITTSSSQVVMDATQDSHIESIEMIQREIESHGELKQASLYDDSNNHELESENQLEKPAEIQTRPLSDNETLIESLRQGQQLEFTTTPPEETEPEPEAISEASPEDQSEEVHQIDIPENADEENILVPEIECDNLDQTNENNEDDQNRESPKLDETPTEPTEEEPNVEETEDPTTEEPVDVLNSVEAEEEPNGAPSQKDVNETNPEEESGSDKVFEENEEPTQAQPIEDGSGENVDYIDVVEDSSIAKEENDSTPTLNQELMEVDEQNGICDITDQSLTQESEVEKGETEPDGNCKEPEEQMEVQELTESVVGGNESADGNAETVVKNEEGNAGEELSQSDTSTSQFNDENSRSSQDSQINKIRVGNEATKISILDDWEDTDSQQSEHRDKVEIVGTETVDKLMDDWEDEEEEENKKVTA